MSDIKINLKMSEKFRGSHLKSIWRTCNKIRAALHQVKINLWDYFRPLDTYSSGLVSGSIPFFIKTQGSCSIFVLQI